MDGKCDTCFGKLNTRDKCVNPKCVDYNISLDPNEQIITQPNDMRPLSQKLIDERVTEIELELELLMEK